jgi:hypothetical protein
MQRLSIAFIAGLVITSSALAEEFWDKKDFMKWTDEEVKRVLTNSPWAKDIVITVPASAIGRGGRGTPSAAGTDVENGGGGRGGGRGRRDSLGAEGGDAGPRETQLSVNISWRSARPLRKALVRSRIGVEAAVPAEATQMINNDEESYVIIVSGIPNGMARTIQNSELEKSVLRIGRKAPIVAKSINIQPRPQSVEVVYAFPKSAPIVAEDKEVEVDLWLGPAEAKKKFSLKEMVYNGKLEL